MGLGLGSVWVWVWGRLGFGHLVRFRVTGLAARWALVSVMVRVSLGVKVTDKVRVRIRVRIRVRVRVRVSAGRGDRLHRVAVGEVRQVDLVKGQG